MSKNLTRKGLAFGALVALGSSVLAGAPAYAADSVVLAADYSVDKTLAVPMTETIRLNASLAPGSTAANISQLTYKVVTDSTTVASVQTISGASGDTGYNKTVLLGTYTATSANAGDKVYTKQTPLTSGDTVANLFGASATALTTTYFKPANTPSAVNVNTITVGVNSIPNTTTATTGAGTAAELAAGATRSVTVTAFIDANLNGLLDTGEVSQEQTVKFVKNSEVTATTTITAPTQNDTTVTALVKFTNVNNQALADTVSLANGGNGSNASSIGAYFTKGDGTALKTADAPLTISTATVSSTTATYTASAAHTLNTGDVVTVAGLSTAALNGSQTLAGSATPAFTTTVASGTASSTTAGTASRVSIKPASAAISGTTLTFTAGNVYNIGDVVTVAGVTGTLATVAGTSLAGSYVVTAANATTFAVTIPTGYTVPVVTSAVITRTASNYEAVQFTPVAGFSATNDGFKFTTGTVPGLGKSTAVKVQPLFNSKAALTATLGSGGTKTIATAQTAQVATRVLGSFAGNTVKSTTAAEGTLGAAATAAVALNSEKSVYFIAKDTATTPAAKAGQAVAVAVTTSATLSSTITLTVAGTTYTSNAALPGATGVAKLALTTGSDGKATIAYKTAGYSGTETVAFAATAENFSASVTATETVRDYTGSTTYIANNEGNTAVTTDGTAVAVNVVVQDQFGGAPADASYQVTATFDTTAGNGYVAQATTAATTASSTYAAVVGGKANLTITDNGTGLGTNLYIIDLRAVAANGVLGNSIKAIANPLKIKIVAAADTAAGEVLLTGATTLSATTGNYSINTGTLGAAASANNAELTYSAFGNVDMRAIAVTAPSKFKNDGTTAVTEVTFGGTVNSASTSTYGGVAVPSASVTVSGAGLMFAADQDGVAVYGDGSLTVLANASGVFSVNVWGHKAGKQLVTVTSGTGKATLEITFKAAVVADASAVTVKVADGSAQFQSGRALDVTVTVADKFANPVVTASSAGTDTGVLTLSQTGAGYLATTGLVVTDSTGVYSTKLITNAGDLGTSTIKASFDVTDATAADIVTTNSSEFGITDVTDISSAGKAIYVNTEFAKGKVVTVYIDGKRMPVKAAEATDNAVERKYTQKKAGKHTVTVRVSGGVVASETVVTTK